VGGVDLGVFLPFFAAHDDDHFDAVINEHQLQRTNTFSAAANDNRE
jgi:hypothetical protein